MAAWTFAMWHCWRNSWRWPGDENQGWQSLTRKKSLFNNCPEAVMSEQNCFPICWPDEQPTQALPLLWVADLSSVVRNIHCVEVIALKRWTWLTLLRFVFLMSGVPCLGLWLEMFLHFLLQSRTPIPTNRPPDTVGQAKVHFSKASCCTLRSSPI